MSAVLDKARMLRSDARDEAADVLALAGLNAEQIGNVLDILATERGAQILTKFATAHAHFVATKMDEEG